MSMSTHAVGLRPPDDEWRKMKAAWDACKDIGVKPPVEVQEFFEYDEPDDKGVEIDITAAVSRYTGESVEGYEIDVTKLPKDVKLVRVYNSY